jgi:hypothetical protein
MPTAATTADDSPCGMIKAQRSGRLPTKRAVQAVPLCGSILLFGHALFDILPLNFEQTLITIHVLLMCAQENNSCFHNGAPSILFEWPLVVKRAVGIVFDKSPVIYWRKMSRIVMIRIASRE